jgi:hypothetical protein
MKDGLRFFDSAMPYDNENLLSHSSLVEMHVMAHKTEPMPIFDDVLNPPRWVKFDEWWNGLVLVDKEKNEFSRRDIVLNLANKDGGAHVDHKIDEKYQKLRAGNGLGWFTIAEDGRSIAGEDHVPATMRQIAHEMLKSLDPEYTKVKAESEARIIFRGASIVAASSPGQISYPNLRKDRPVVNGKKIGRNDMCPCLSGKKYKRCCIAA